MRNDRGALVKLDPIDRALIAGWEAGEPVEGLRQRLGLGPHCFRTRVDLLGLPARDCERKVCEPARLMEAPA